MALIKTEMTDEMINKMRLFLIWEKILINAIKSGILLNKVEMGGLWKCGGHL